ncbi:MAG TPA: sensor domain-containing diguanylate cyclase [Candidatus Eisenbacteria bacterium]|nr:sensor domain-containing diguanylate cyclase [Candidatus Eisenbacteria bacterium]
MDDLAGSDLFFATLQEITSLINGGKAQETIFESVLSCALQMLEAQAVFLITVDGPRIRKFALRATPDGHILGLERYELPSQAGITRWVLLEGQPVHVPDVGADPRYHPSIDSLPGIRTSACLAAPLKVRDAILGVLVAVNRVDATPFDDRHLRVLSLLANQTAIAIENAKLFRRAEQLAVTDDLTQVYNYRFLKMGLRREVKRAARFSQKFSLLMIDVDNLKRYNDQNGHLRGSEVLRQIAQILVREARSIDLVAKYGGDEFVVILPQTAREGACVLADRVKSSVAATAFPHVTPGVITVSLGVATYPENGITAGELLESADIALYAAKQSGKNRVSIASTDPGSRGFSSRHEDGSDDSTDSF